MYSGTKELLSRAMVGGYENKIGHASVCCRIIYSEEDVTARVRLMEYFLADFGLTTRTGKLIEEYPAINFSDEFVTQVLSRIVERVANFINDLFRENPRSMVLARKVVKFLDTYADPEDKFFVLAMIMFSPLVPYTQLTSDMFEHGLIPNKILIDSKDFNRSVAIMMRIFEQPGLDFKDILSIVRSILLRHKDPNEFQMLLLCFAVEFEKKQTKERFENLLSKGGLLSDILSKGLPQMVAQEMPHGRMVCKN